MKNHFSHQSLFISFKKNIGYNPLKTFHIRSFLVCLFLLGAQCMQAANSLQYTVGPSLYAVNKAVCCPPYAVQALNCTSMVWSTVNTLKNTGSSTLTSLQIETAINLPGNYPQPTFVYVTDTFGKPLNINTQQLSVNNMTPSATITTQATTNPNNVPYYGPGSQWLGYQSSPSTLFSLLAGQAITYRLVYVWESGNECRYIQGSQYTGTTNSAYSGSFTSNYNAFQQPQILVCTPIITCYGGKGDVYTIDKCTYPPAMATPPSFGASNWFVLYGGPVSPDTTYDGHFTNIGAGTYTLTIIDTPTNNLVAMQVFTVTQPDLIDTTISVTACNSYTYIGNGVTYTVSGTYIDTLFNQAANGCDSVVTLNLTINNSTTSSTSVTACDSYTWVANGVTYTASGTYTFTSINATGCTNTDTLHLTINNSTTSSFTVVACNSYTWAANGVTYTASGTYTFTSLNAAGCTNTATLNLTINSSTSNSTTVSAGGSYTWAVNGLTYTASGTYTYTSSNVNGCLYTQTLNLTIIPLCSAILSLAEDQPISCFGNNDASLQASMSPIGTYTFTVLSPDASTSSNTTGYFDHLIPGTHTVYATDGSCIASQTITFIEPDPIDLVFVTDSLVSCLGSDGQLSIVITGGTNILQGYLTWWTNAAGDTLNDIFTNNFALTISSLSAGNYNVAIEDDHGCFYSETGPIEVAAPIVVTASFNPILCHNGTTVITLAATGGVPYTPLSYVINGSPIAASYPAGSYTITATDAKGCTGTTAIHLSNPSSISGSSSVSACNSYTWNSITYTASGVYIGTFTSANGCDSIHALTLSFINGVFVSPKVLLSAPYSSAGLMHDSLRVKGLIPYTEPYTALSFTPIGNVGGETVSPAMLAVTGSNAIVDWVHIEIRTGAPSYMKVATQNALLQRDGDVVDVNGSPLYFSALCPGDYFVSVKHRNHLGVMTANAVSLSSTTQLVDFTTSAPVWTKPGVANAARETNGAYRLLWPGDTRTDKNVKYNGLNNDKEAILYAVGVSTPNNILNPVYRREDANMDGRVKYNNADNDKNFMLNKILQSNYPVSTPNDILSQHTPN